MTAGRGSDDGVFSWPPTDSDLAVIAVVPAATAALSTGGRVAGPRPAGFRRADGLLLLAAGMLFGSAVPSLDTAPPTRIGMQSGEAAAGRVAVGSVAPGPTATPATIAGPSRDADAPMPHVTAPATTTTAAAAAIATTSARPVAGETRPPRDPRTRQVLAVVQTYGRAWSRMDARAARAAMPSANIDELTRTFTTLREQKLTLSGCRIGGTGSTATASCTATRRYRPRQGDHSTRVERGRWQFRVVRTPQRWVIADVDRG